MRTAVVAALAVLALPASAVAKEVGSLSVCGTTGCHAITAKAPLRGFIDGGYETLAPARGGPYFALNVRMRHDGQEAGGFTVQYLRAANLIRAQGEYGKDVWTRPAGVTAQALRRAARGLRPYPAEVRSEAGPASRRPRGRARHPLDLGPVREPPPAPAGSPPARARSAAAGGGSSLLGFAGAGAVLALAAGAFVARRRRNDER
jgi:hypothetical protein